MSEGNTPNPKLGKRAQSPSKITPKEDENNIKLNKNINMTEQVINKNKSILLGKLTEDFIDEEESEGISITYKEQNKKVKTISFCNRKFYRTKSNTNIFFLSAMFLLYPKRVII